MPQTFGIDTRWVEGPAAGGVKTYIEWLCRELLTLDQEDRFHFWGSPVGVGTVNSHVDQFQGLYRRGWQLAWKTLGFPKMDMVAPRADLWHFTNFTAPPTNTPFVVTIHDLTFIEHPEYVEPKNLKFLENFVPETIERAERIIVNSQFTGDAIGEHFPQAAQKVVVTPLACDPAFFSPPQEEDLNFLRDKYGIDSDYVLTVGTLEPRKNLRTLLLALAGIRRETTEQLVVVGPQGWLFEETQELLRKLGLGNRVIFTDHAPQRELSTLYYGAKAFVFPSHYEGFGLPVLEAMAAGTPVLCSNAASLPEVAGGAALYFDPDDAEALGLALKRVLGDDALRQRLKEAGQERATDFSWRRMAEQTLDVYRSVLA